MLLPKTTIAQRGRFYEDVETLLSPGFLTHQVVVSGVKLQIRSLSSGDLFLLRARTEGGTSRQWREWAVASAIWMIDGRVLLGQDDAIPFLMQYVQQLPSNVLNILFSTLLGLWVRVGDAIETIEVFNYEVGSRYKWKSIHKHIQDSGVPGAECLGLNTVQRIWMAFNEMEDSRRSDDTAWESAKLVASSNSPKAVAKMDEKDRQRRQAELDLRQKRMDQFFYEKIKVLLPADQTGSEGPTHRIQGTKSVEDLEEEMRRWVTGDADFHDAIVDAWKNQVRAKQAQDKADLEARRQVLQAERERLYAEAEESDFHPQPLLALTAAQLQHMLQNRGDYHRPGVSFVPTTQQHDRVYNKYLTEGAVQGGALQVQGNKVLDPNADPEVDARTLNQLISERKPTLGSGTE